MSECQFYHLLAVKPWANYLISFTSIIYKVGIIIIFNVLGL